MDLAARWAQLHRGRTAEAPLAVEPVHETPPAAEHVHGSPPAAEPMHEPQTIHGSPPAAEPVQEPKPVHKSSPAAEPVHEPKPMHGHHAAHERASSVREGASSVRVQAQSALAMLVQDNGVDEEVAGLAARLQARLAAAGAQEPVDSAKHAREAVDFAMTQLDQLSQRTDLQMAYVRQTVLVHLGKLHCCVPDVMVEVDRLLEALSETTAAGDVHDTGNAHNTNAESPDVHNQKWGNWANMSEEPLKTEPRADATGWWPGQPASKWSAQASSAKSSRQCTGLQCRGCTDLPSRTAGGGAPGLGRVDDLPQH